MAGDETVSGVFYGIGVGPGDPELMTVKAWRIVSTVPVLAYLAASGSESTARNIAKPFIPEDIIEIAIDVPMKMERAPAQAAYDAGAARIREHLVQGRDVAMLCEGDPFFYGSFMYVFSRLARDFETVVVPGVSSITACAARIGRPLAARNEVLKVIPATLEAGRLCEELRDCESAAIIKVGRHFAKVRDTLAELGLIANAVAVDKATREGERIAPVADVDTETMPYFATILVYAGKEHW